MPKQSNGTSARDPLSQIRGDPSLDAVWRDALQGDSTVEGRAALIAHYRKERERHFKKKAEADED